ncbi:MAG: dipeptidase [Pseudomonadota bacterium]
MTPPVPVFDGHNDTLLKLELAARAGSPLDFYTDNGSDLDIDLPRARASGFAGGFFAMFSPRTDKKPGEDFDPGDPANFEPVPQARALEITLAMFARMRRLARDLPDDLAICSDVAEIRTTMETGQIALLPHIEGAECIDPGLDTLEVLHAAGLRSLGLVWSRPNIFGHGAPMDAQPELDPGEGLTDAGRALVRACNRLGIMIDLSHLTERGFWDVAEVTDKPLVATHSNVHAICPSARNLTDDQLRAVAASGGVVGLNFNCSFLRPDCADDTDVPMTLLLRHLDHMLEIVGENGVALGSDYDGCLLPAEIANVTGLPRLTAAMRQANYGDDLINKICSENWLDLLGRAGVGG